MDESLRYLYIRYKGKQKGVTHLQIPKTKKPTYLKFGMNVLFLDSRYCFVFGFKILTKKGFYEIQPLRE